MPRLSPVVCSLELAADPSAPGDHSTWRVLRADVAQRIDHPWAGVLTLVTDTLEVQLEQLLGRSATLLWERPGSDTTPHRIHGLVTRAECLGVFDEQLHIRMRLEPALALLRLGRRRRIFEDLTVPAIVAQVLDPVFAARSAELLVDGLVEGHTERDYCVQYDESDLDFVRRILAEDGLALTFDPTATADHARLTDTNDAFVAVEHVSTSMSSGSPPEVPIISVRHEEAEDESIQALWSSHGVTSERFFETAWDFKHQPPTRLRSSADVQLGTSTGDHLSHNTARLVELDRGDGPTDDATATMAQRAAERAEVEALELHGRGNVAGFAPGTTFEVFGHPHESFNDRAYLLTRVHHRIDIPSAAFAGRARSSSYHNEFCCGPLDRRYRSARRPSPRAHGPETALVVGPEPEEIHTDQHGRVRVCMHWDERDKPSSSCWLRVGQAWAGAGFGTLFLPRVGMEVIVSFLGGDPDRPIVSGCVYNAANVPPVALPEHRTQSTIRTSSCPGGRGHNELRFEDSQGHEEVYLRAQRNLREQVLADHSTTIGRDQALRIKRNRHSRVDHEDVLEVGDFRELYIAGAHSIFTEEAFIVSAKGPKSRHVGGKAIEISTPHQAEVLAGETLELVCAKTGTPISRIEMQNDGIKISANTETVELTPGRINLAAKDAIVLSVGGTSLSLQPQGLEAFGATVKLAGGSTQASGMGNSELVLDERRACLASLEKVQVEGSGASMTLTGDVSIEGESATINGHRSALVSAPDAEVSGTTEARLCGGGGLVKCVAAMVSLDGG